MEPRDFVGRWWHPANPDRKVGGTLTVGAGGPEHLELTDQLYTTRGGKRVPPRDGSPVVDTEDPELICGIADGKVISIISPLSVHEPFTFGTGGTSTYQTIAVDTAIIGLGLSSANDKIFSGIDIEIDNLASFSGISGMSRDFSDAGEFGVSLNPVDGVEVEVAGLNFKLMQRTGSASRVTTGGIENTLTERIFARITASSPQDWDGWRDPVRELRDLITLATQFPCQVRSRHLIIVDDEGGDQRHELLIRTDPILPPDKVRKNKFLFSLKDIEFASALPAWLTLRSKVGTAISVLFSLDYDRNGYYETRIFNAASAAEAVHRALRPNSRSISRDKHRTMMREVRAALGEEDYKWVQGRLANRPGFTQRLQELAEIPDTAAVANILSDVNRWATWMEDARNAIAHMSTKKLDAIPDTPRYLLCDVTRAVLHLVLLHELGLSASVQRRAAENVFGQLGKWFASASTAT